MVQGLLVVWVSRWQCPQRATRLSRQVWPPWRQCSMWWTCRWIPPAPGCAATVVVADQDRFAEGCGRGVAGAAEVHRLGVRPEHDRQDLPVAGQPAGGLRGHRGAVDVRGWCGAGQAEQGVVGDQDVDGGSFPARRRELGAGVGQRHHVGEPVRQPLRRSPRVWAGLGGRVRLGQGTEYDRALLPGLGVQLPANQPAPGLRAREPEATPLVQPGILGGKRLLPVRIQHRGKDSARHRRQLGRVQPSSVGDQIGLGRMQGRLVD